MEIKHDKMDAVRKHIARNNDSALKRFARYAIVGGALMLGCNPAAKSGETPKPAPQTMTQSAPATKPSSTPSARDMVEGWAKECNGEQNCILQKALAANAKDGEYKVSGPMDSGPTKAEERKSTLHTGQEFCLGANWRSMYGIKIVSVDKGAVYADITIPVGLTKPTVNIMSFSFKLNNIRLPESLSRSLELMAPKPGIDWGQAKSVYKASESKCEIPESFKIAKIGHQDEYFVAIGDALSTLSSLYGVDSGVVKAKFAVSGTNSKEILLKAQGGPLDGQTIRLDRSIGVNIEFINEKAGYFSFTPNMIDTLSVDSKGKINGTLKRNEFACSAVYMEIFMSEHAGSKPAMTLCGAQNIVYALQPITVRVGTSIFPDDPESQKVVKIDEKGLLLDDGSRWDYGQKRTYGEFVLTTSMELKKGADRSPVIVVAHDPNWEDAGKTSNEVMKEFERK